MAPKVECLAFGTGELSSGSKEFPECPDFNFDFIEVNDTDPIISGQYICEAENEDGCAFR